ncbi:MAG: FAD-dependent oxidoreductase [Gammaproteobacteria bacterium]|nr:FAD-dependent oxidoreductase [Gammaproteobacteria bacterium]
MSKQVVIVGAGHASGQVVATLKQKQYDGRIVLVGEEAYLPYQRPPLSKKFLAGMLAAERLYVKPESFYDSPDIEVRLSTHVDSIDRASKTVVTDQRDVIPYDSLILAIGARARKLPVEGSMLAGIYYLRSIDDVNGIRDELDKAKSLVIVGGGYIGLEVAAVTRQLGLDVTVIEMTDRVMSRVVSEDVSAFFQREHFAHGVKLMLSTGLCRFRGDDRVTAVETDDGQRIPADFVVVGVGITPNVELAEAAGLNVDDGIVVDEHCLTSGADIYAIGDCTSHPNNIYGRRMRLESVHNALEQAKTAAANVCGEKQKYAQVPWFWSDQYDLKLQIAGVSQGYDDIVIRGDVDSRSFSCLYLKEGTLIAVDAINAPHDFVQSKLLIANAAAPDRTQLANTDVMLKDLA